MGFLILKWKGVDETQHWYSVCVSGWVFGGLFIKKVEIFHKYASNFACARALK